MALLLLVFDLTSYLIFAKAHFNGSCSIITFLSNTFLNKIQKPPCICSMCARLYFRMSSASVALGDHCPTNQRSSKLFEFRIR